MLKIYGALFPLHGKKGTERFFPGRKKIRHSIKSQQGQNPCVR